MRLAETGSRPSQRVPPAPCNGRWRLVDVISRLVQRLLARESMREAAVVRISDFMAEKKQAIEAKDAEQM